MKPFVVEYVIRAVVMAADKDDAYAVAKDEWYEVRADERPDVEVEAEVFNERQLPSGWDLECIPYGGDGNTRLEKILADQVNVG